jgi:hypothetical protein
MSNDCVFIGCITKTRDTIAPLAGETMKPRESDPQANQREEPEAGKQLTEEQMAFAKMLGQVLAQKWQLEQQCSSKKNQAPNETD